MDGRAVILAAVCGAVLTMNTGKNHEAVEPTKELDEDHIRHRAYMLWLEEGQPEGKAEEGTGIRHARLQRPRDDTPAPM